MATHAAKAFAGIPLTFALVECGDGTRLCKLVDCGGSGGHMRDVGGEGGGGGVGGGGDACEGEGDCGGGLRPVERSVP